MDLMEALDIAEERANVVGFDITSSLGGGPSCFYALLGPKIITQLMYESFDGPSSPTSEILDDMCLVAFNFAKFSEYFPGCTNREKAKELSWETWRSKVEEVFGLKEKPNA